MASPSTADISFEEFLRQLAEQRGKTRKLRFAARYWRKLERLPDSERQRVALALGSEAAWKQLERLFLRDGTLSDEERLVQQALDRLGSADPAELRRWAGVLRSGDTRQVGKLVTSAVEAALEQEAGMAEEIDAAIVGEPPVASPEGDAGGSPVEALDSAGVAVAGGDHRSTAPPPVSGRPASRTRPAPPRDRGASPRDATTPASVDSSPASQGISATTAMRGAVGPEPGRPATADAEPARPATAPWSDGFAGAPRSPRAGELRRGYVDRPTPMTAAERLRELGELRRNPAGVAALGVDGRAALVAGLGSGWASRRAVSAMIRAGAVAGVDEALQLIAGLDTPTRRNWCLGVLLDNLELTEDERERVLDAVPSAAARRRLARRARPERDGR